ncbi:amino acid permease [Phenylobacterium hankyongense]|uniref:Amino acid permease n=1 Tax=Phenylobacterium hankyongense TaxID=1813876 RepID=A0A328B2R7_9CAUL|nr:amino acid permease [Phenylobacterium hankyongense]RAK60216.1 amino acid permease [Phenylobacterium hankyongense]
MTPAPRARGLTARKTVAGLQADAMSHGLKRTLGPIQLMLLGVGCILGAGIYVMTGTAAANFAGPAVVLSFIIAGVTCGLTALCYAELASAMPVAGSSYSYCYAALGEVFAWILGWLLMLEYGLAASTLAVGFSGYFASLAHGFGVAIPAALITPTIHAAAQGAAHAGATANVVAVGAILAVTVVLVLGVSESARVNAVLVAVKLLVLAAFVAMGVGAIQPHNWTPFIPPNEGGFVYGWAGVFRGASILFFAYLGFETVSTAGSETRDPQKAMPIGILGALIICTIVYIVVAVVLTGVVPFRELGVSDPIAIAADRMGRPQMAMLIKLGALVGLASVLLVNGYGQSRVAFAMARDGLLPGLFARLHRRFRTPHLAIVILGLVSAVLAAMFPLALLADLVSLGTALAFSIVCISLMWLRATQPDLPRPFRVPFGGMKVGPIWIGVIPVGALVMCWVMIVPVSVDLISKAGAGNPAPMIFLVVYAAAGAAVYLLYGRRKSRVQGDPLAATHDLLKEAGGAS